MIDAKKHAEDALRIAGNLQREIQDNGLTTDQAVVFLTGALASNAAYAVQLIRDAKEKDKLIARLCERVEKLEGMLDVAPTH